MNRDPITGTPGSHPLGTGVGATGGALAGAAIGSLFGPIGTLSRRRGRRYRRRRCGTRGRRARRSDGRIGILARQLPGASLLQVELRLRHRLRAGVCLRQRRTHALRRPAVGRQPRKRPAQWLGEGQVQIAADMGRSQGSGTRCMGSRRPHLSHLRNDRSLLPRPVRDEGSRSALRLRHRLSPGVSLRHLRTQQRSVAPMGRQPGKRHGARLGTRQGHARAWAGTKPRPR